MTVLGTGAAYPQPGHACSGFLVRTDDTSVLVDAGNGTFARLREHLEPVSLDAVIVTHAHADHMSDVIPLMYALGMSGGPVTTVPMHAPPEVPARLTGMLGATSAAVFDQVFVVSPLGAAFDVGSVHIEPFATEHPTETYGVRMTAGGRVLVYTSDTAWADGLVQRCAGADLLICEATYDASVTSDPGVHLWAPEAGRLASEAGVGRLLLTHVWGSCDPDVVQREAAAVFPGAELATEGQTYAV